MEKQKVHVESWHDGPDSTAPNTPFRHVFLFENQTMKEWDSSKMLPRVPRSLKIVFFISSFILLLYFLCASTRDSSQKSIQFNHKNGEIGDQLFSLFSHIGVARTIGRTPVINTVNNAELIEQLSKVVVLRFPSILNQFSIVIQPITPVNGNLGTDEVSYEDSIERFSQYATLSIMVDGNGFKSYKYFDSIRSEIRLWMLGNAENLQEAKNLLSESLRDNFKLCVHTTSETQKNFTIKAVSEMLNHYTKENDRVMLAVSATDPGFIRNIFQDKRIKKFDIEKFSLVSSPPELQLTFSRIYCDAVFITFPYSSFGWWMGYLAREEKSPVFYFDPDAFPLQNTTIQNDMFPPKWKKVSKKIE
ncbi:hypothetical protein CRE_26543 [Caenorhabditis remanei]|uniref:Uncharacterized protein n=1 Tax=Caenorhabditis remanei TaxID=31234 RepID=E3LR58_CAERE|nr:hypothetical protein CRE_26543 [Caenorhabditis remanei]